MTASYVIRRISLIAAGIASAIMLLGTSGMGHRESSPRRRLATAARGGVPALFIMGDSTVDVGNNNNLITLAQATSTLR